MNYIIRRKERKDCESIAHVVTVAWNETYKGIVPDEFLNNLYENEGERFYNSFINFPEEDNHQFILEINNEIVGFVNVGASDDEDYNDCGEIYAIYLLNEYKGKGYGKELFKAGVNELKKMGFKKMIIGCLVKNNSNGFYKHLGGKYVKTRIFKRLNLPEKVYLFEKI